MGVGLITAGEVGVSLKINFKGDSFSFCHHTNASCGDNLLSLHRISPSMAIVYVIANLLLN